VLFKLYLYGYLHRVRSSRLLEAECHRNVEVIWLTGRQAPDFKTICHVLRQTTGIMSLTNFSGGRYAALRRPRLAGRKGMVKAPFFRRLTLLSATGTAQRAVPTLIICKVHNP
jgi:hypothetical protein